MVLGDPVMDTFYGDSVELGCDEGYTLIGESRLTCLETGVWSSDVPHCQPPIGMTLGLMLSTPLRKHAYSNIWKTSPPKKLKLFR